MKNILIFIPLFVFIQFGFSQSNRSEIKTMDFGQLKPLLEKQNDTVYVVNFWATWCKPCVDELPHFLKIAESSKNQNVKFLFISLDFPRQYESRLVPFVSERKITETVILLNDPAANKWINLVDSGWSGAIPATLIYKNNQRFFIEGSMEEAELISTINQINTK